MPGNFSQGWPGLVFLSSFAFLSPQEQADLHLDPVTRALDSQVLVHETAHQWWGDLVLWKSYHDQWIAEGLANYASLLILEQQNPGAIPAGPGKVPSRPSEQEQRWRVVARCRSGDLGQRLDSSHFPSGYEAISYERGTWLFHMLRMHAARFRSRSRSRKARRQANSDEPFFRALRKIRDRYAGKRLSTQEMIAGFRRGTAAPTLVRESSQTGLVFGRMDQRDGDSGAGSPKSESREKAGVTTVTGVIVQKDAPDDLVTAVPCMPRRGNAQVFLGEVLADGRETAFRLTAPSDVRKIVLDPKQTILTAPK